MKTKEIKISSSLGFPIKIHVVGNKGKAIMSDLKNHDESYREYSLTIYSPEEEMIVMIHAFSGPFIKKEIIRKKTSEISLSIINFATPYELPDPAEYEKERFKDTGRLFWLPPRPLNYLVDAGYMETNIAKFIILRHQQWVPISDGISIAPGETVTHFTSIESGRHESSSTREHLEKNVSATASAGWGAFSASVSASMSKSSDIEHIVSTEEKKTTSQTIVYENKDEASVLVVVKWQLIEKLDFHYRMLLSKIGGTIVSRKLPIITQSYRILNGKRIGTPE